MNRRCLLLLLLFGVTALSLSSAVPIQSRPSGADSVHAARSPSLLETQVITTDAEQDAYDDDDGMSHEDDHFPDNFGNSSTASFVESEAFLTQFELPSSALCARTTHDWQYAQHDAFQEYMAMRQNRESKNPPITPWTFSPGNLREHHAYANLQPRLVDECPLVALDPDNLRADPVFFGACCGSRGRYHCRRVLKGNPAEAALYAQLKAEWDKVKAKSVPEILAAIQVPCDNNRERRVCDRNEQCGKGYKCCWSGRYGAPGVCRKKGCGHIREEVRGRCDTKADCEYTSATEKCCFIHRSLTTFAGGRNRRGFCSASDECGGKKTSFDCGKGNACAGPSLNPNRQDLKCCQKLENTLDFSPKRMCALNCNAPHRADVTNIERDHTALIPTIPLTKKKTDTTWFARSYNMMRFAQMATTLFNNADNFETFEAVQKKIELEQFCEKKHLKMQKTARTAALHITNSLLSVLSPYLLVELAYKPTSGEGEKEETFYNNFKALGNLNRVNLQTLSGDFHGNPDLAKRAIFYLLDFEGEPDPQNIRAEVNTLHTFLDQFTLEPKSDTEAGWFTRMTENFGRMKQEVKSVCDRYVRLEYRDDAGQTQYLLKKVDYARFAHWMENPADFENFLAIRSLKHAPADITPDGVARNIRTLKTQVTPSFEKGRACFTVWNKIVFGLHLLNEALEVKNGEFNKKLGILSETTNIVGTLASSVSFGGSAVAAKGINFCIKQAQKHIMTQTKANEALIEALLADFLAEPAKEHNKACSRFVAMANLAPSPRVYESLCPPMKLYPEALPAGPNEHVVSPSVVTYFQNQQLPKFLHEIVNSHCHKARVLHGALKTATAAETTAIKAAEPNAPAAVGAETDEQKAQRIAAFVDKDPQVVAARKAKAVPLNGLQRELNKVIGAYRQCSFNNDLESQFDAVEEIFKASLSMTSCHKLKNEHLVDAREYFTEKVVAVTHEERDLYDLYHNTLKEGAVLKVLEALVKIVGAVAEPLGARFMEMTFGHLAVFETAEQAILQGMARSGISVAPPVTQDQILELQAQINEIRGVGNGENR